MFQSTRPRGARHPSTPFCSSSSVFQSTRPRGARLPKGPSTGRNIVFQSTRPRGARQEIVRRFNEFPEVSIHAPTWGTTIIPTHQAGTSYVSIHAPTWGATLPMWICAIQALFQSTRPRGARLSASFLILISIVVSIHAPTWGATCYWLQLFPCTPRFNPRAHVGRDLALAELMLVGRFQSTRPRGARPQGRPRH